MTEHMINMLKPRAVDLNSWHCCRCGQRDACWTAACK